MSKGFVVAWGMVFVASTCVPIIRNAILGHHHYPTSSMVVSMAGVLVALAVMADHVWVVYDSAPQLLPPDAWLITALDLLAHWALVWEITAFCSFLNDVEFKGAAGGFVAELRNTWI
ncbi:hypothetical protein Pcinc_003217 [Petrolisthes cinctipes]|uniref:Uncharacterized protein n=1 Tax=Petrolisthes cinctipes TaxID=88211 RepID=A0AAE1GH39_PETCI|nr:hypothetical protein Pcinc_003217 [Petrolisthes cinctipes]